MDSIPTPDALLPLGLFMALLLVAGIAALGHFAWQVHPSREAWPERLRRLADASPWRWRDLGWIFLLTAAAQTLRRFVLPNTPVWHVAAFHGVLCAAILWRMQGKVRPFGPPLPWRTAAGQALLRWLAVLPILWFTGFAWQILLRVAGYVPEFQQVIRLFMETTDPWRRAAFLLMAVGLAPVVEEGLFRGILLPLVSRRLGPRAGLILVSVGFAALHGDLGSFAALVVMALALGLAYVRTGSLWVPIAMHMIFNAVNLVLLLLLLRAGFAP